MAKVRFSRRAETAFDAIAEHAVQTWNADQADRSLALQKRAGLRSVRGSRPLHVGANIFDVRNASATLFDIIGTCSGSLGGQ